jgi:hypothetical protein
MLRLALQGDDHDRAGEALAEAHALGAIKIAAARFALRPQPFQLALVRLLEFDSRDAVKIVDAPENDRRAYLEASAKARKRIA